MKPNTSRSSAACIAPGPCSITRGGLLGRRALHLVGFLVFVYLFLKLVPGFAGALESLRGVSISWIVGAIFLETLSRAATSSRGPGSSTPMGS